MNMDRHKCNSLKYLRFVIQGKGDIVENIINIIGICLFKWRNS